MISNFDELIVIPIAWPDHWTIIPKRSVLYTKCMQPVDDVIYISNYEAHELFKRNIVLDIVKGRWALPFIKKDDKTYVLSSVCSQK